MERHTDDLRNVKEGDTVDITTTEGEEIRVTCTHTQTDHAAPESGEVRETSLWMFNSPEHSLGVAITDGLKSSPDDADFPQHSPIWDEDEKDVIGYIKELSIYGEMEGSP